MARQEHTPLAAPGTRTDAYAAGAADLTMLAADAVNGDVVLLTRPSLIVAHNTDAAFLLKEDGDYLLLEGGDRIVADYTAHTITISSVAEPIGREDDISISLDAEFAVIGPLQVAGWAERDRWLRFEADDAAIKLGVVRL